MVEYSHPWDKDLAGDRGPYEASFFSRKLNIHNHRDGIYPRDNDGVNTCLQVKQQTVADMSVRVAKGAAFLKGNALEKAHEYYNDDFINLDISDNLTGNPRIDRVILRLDYAAQEVRLAVLTGTPAGSPVAPSLQQDATYWEIAIAQIAVAAGESTSIETADITMEASNAILLPAIEGGTGIDSYAAGDLLVANAVNTLAKLAAVDFGQIIGDSAKAAKMSFVSMRRAIIGGNTTVTLGTTTSGTVIPLASPAIANPDNWISSIASNQFFLTAGYYEIEAFLQIENNNAAARNAIAWIHNATTSAVVAQGDVGAWTLGNSGCFYIHIPPIIFQSNGTDAFELRAFASGSGVSSQSATLTPSPTGGYAGVQRMIHLRKVKI